MLLKNNFVRINRRPSYMLPQVVVLAVLFVVSLVGVASYLHFSSDSSDAATLGAEDAAVVPASQPMITVLVPNGNIAAGVALESRMFRQDSKPEEFFGAEFVRSFDDVKGLFTKGMLLANQPINRELLTSVKPVNFLTQSISPGYRAIAIGVDTTSSVEGWAQSGSRVDVYWLTSYSGRKTISLIASDVGVLSANRQAQSSSRLDGFSPIENPNTVTLLLSQRDAMRVRLASLHGRISLVLRGRNEGGLDSGPLNPIDDAGLHNLPMPQAPPPSPGDVVVVKDRETGEQEVITFRNGARVNK